MTGANFSATNQYFNYIEQEVSVDFATIRVDGRDLLS